jgi:hypothetical protein
MVLMPVAMLERSSIMVSMVNRLSTDQRAQIVSCLFEGMSIRATVRITGAAKTASSSCWWTLAAPAPNTRIQR